MVGSEREEEEIPKYQYDDGSEEDIRWFFDKLAKRFDCKEDEWLTKGNPIDFLDISMDDDRIWIQLSHGWPIVQAQLLPYKEGRDVIVLNTS